MALYFPNFCARAGATRLGASRGRVFLPVALYFPNFRARAGAARLGASRGRAFLSTVFRPPYAADAALGFMRHLGKLSWPRPLGRNRRGLNMPLRHVQHRSRTKVRFAPLLNQSDRLKPMFADIFCECEPTLNFCARAGAHLPKAISSHKKCPHRCRHFVLLFAIVAEEHPRRFGVESIALIAQQNGGIVALAH